MSEFVKPNQVYVEVKTELQRLLHSGGLRKDLDENEALCKRCGGTGLVIADNVYGIKGDPTAKEHFPYKHQAFTFCPDCHNGVVHVCPHCHEPILKQLVECKCEGAVKIRDAEAQARDIELLNNAIFCDADALGKQFGMAWSEHFGYKDGFFEEWEEFFDYWACNFENNDRPERPEFVWGTSQIEFKLNADDIIAAGTEDLYDDAADFIGEKDVKQLQEFLDEWCKTCGLGLTYYAEYTHKIRIPWEDFDGQEEE